VCCCGTLLLKCYIYEFNYLYDLTSILMRISCIKRLDVSGMTWLFVGDDVDS
jgi:hypothetical protein